ncbi:CHAT domain-containing protein [Phormidium nigroviride]
MFQRIWQQFLHLWRRVKQVFIKSPPPPPTPTNPPPSSSECEQKFMELLEGVANGWSRGTIQGFLIGTKIKNADWEKWLQAFGDRLLASPELNLELGEPLSRLGEANYGKISDMAGKIGRELLARENQGREIPGEMIGEENEQKLPIFTENSSPESATTSVINKQESTSQPAATEIEISQDAVELFNQATELWKSGDYQSAIALCEQAIQIQPNYAAAWYRKGTVLNDLGHYSEAIAAYDKSLEFEPNYDYPWYGKGITLYNLERYIEAIAAFDQALEIEPKYHLAWYGKGITLSDLGRYIESIAAFDQALEIEPKYHLAWYGKGITLSDLERYIEAIAAFDQALEIEPKYHLAWYGKGEALSDLGRYIEAIAAFDKALEITKNQYWKAWYVRGWAFLNCGDYEKAIQNWDEGLEKYLPSNRDYRLAYGQLHHQKGQAHYKYGKQTTTYFEYFHKAKASYEQACEYLKSPLIAEVYIEVLQDLIVVCRSLGDPKTNEYLDEATNLLENLILDDDTPPEKKLRLARKFAGIYQLGVDKLVESGDKVKAIETAEKRKNFCLKWMQQGWQQLLDSTNFSQMQELLKKDSQTAIIYWHLSPVTLTTFIITPEKFEAISTPLNPIFNNKNQSLEKWLQDWKTRYQDSRKTKGEKAPAETNSWQDNLESSLEELGRLLNIAEICDRHLSGINQLIFIPHRDLHLLPLHALFNQEKYTTIYLPSAQIGIDRKNRPATNPTAQLLCIKHPGNDEKNKLLFADVEAPAISLLCNGELIEDEDATLDRVLLQIPTSGYLHFTCHGIHDFKTPINSALELHSKLLTLEDIFKLQELPSCHLVCLSACETGLTSTKDLLEEFIGLSSSFLAVGATYVVSTLWSVEDISSTLIMVKFYQLLFAEKLTPPTALKKAQDWLRTATCDLLIKWYNELIPAVSNSRRCRGNLEGLRAQVVKEAEEKGLDYQPYSDCYHWAGFIITGKIPD